MLLRAAVALLVLLAAGHALAQTRLIGIEGQSNAMGFVVGSTASLDPNVCLFDNAYTWRCNVGEPFDCALTTCGLACNQSSCPQGCNVAGCSDAVASDGVSPEYGFAQRLAHLLAVEHGWTVGIVPGPLSSTDICQWLPAGVCNIGLNCGLAGDSQANCPAGTDHRDRSTLYGSALHRESDVATQHGTYLATVMWQGESDANHTLLKAQEWGMRFNAWLDSKQADQPGIPICFMQLQNITATGYPFSNTVRDQQASISRAGVRMVILSQYGCRGLNDPVDTPDGCHCTGLHTGNAQCDMPTWDGLHASVAGYNIAALRAQQCIDFLITAAATPTPTPVLTPTITPICPTCTPPAGSPLGAMGSCPGGTCGCVPTPTP